MLIKFFSKGCIFIFIIFLFLAIYTAYKIYNVVKPILYEKFKGIELLEPERNFKDEIKTIKNKRLQDSLFAYYEKIQKFSNEKKEKIFKSFNRTLNVLKSDKNLDSLELNDLLQLLRTLTGE